MTAIQIEETVQVGFRMPQRILDQIDAYRRELPFIPTRSAVVRHLLEDALAERLTEDPPAKRRRYRLMRGD